ncbi:uncharacterized protein LOC106877292 [Octopus bimaculoides]|uniref:Uncharacterized protein n=1 Tax=Octopus bimaculoides TaxID=37653 RepID=A0A0L8GG60_OCTBM|nr:uncharacterized protein LOC106877292 [Octopus bimaculoides]|eukprot:XP_014781646.1 PREDICTED: uncharacterized protein LOC106877292 [Octopus bimaculoides]
MDYANIVDLDPLIKNWAWTQFQKSSKDAKKHEYKNVLLKINWNHTEFSTFDLEYLNKDRSKGQRSQVVFKSIYENNTKENQENSFTTERTTTSTCTTALTQGFSKGFNIELKLALPEDIMEVSTGFGREVTMEKGSEETHEESLTWTANSSVQVRPKHRTTASLVVTEEEFHCDFRLSVRIRGRIVVVLTNLLDNNSFLSVVEGNIVQLLSSHQDIMRNCRRENGCLIWSVTGKSKFRYGVEQHIKIDEEPLDA